MMDRTTRCADGPPRAPMRPPVPPPDGWTLMGAAEALCPREACLYKRCGAAFDAAAGVDKNGKRDPGGSPEVWLSKLLLAALAKRPDLELTGRDVSRHIRDGTSLIPAR